MRQTISVEYQNVERLKPYDQNARTHSKKQVRQIADSITKFGFTNPILTAADGSVIAGHGRLAAAKLLGIAEVPTVQLSHLTETERRAYVLADNKLALNAGWDRDILAIELQALVDLEFDVEVTGFSLAEIDLVLDAASESSPVSADEAEDEIPPLRSAAVTRRSDIWILGRHKLLCGDSREDKDFEVLLGGDKADLIFTDPPYNVKIDGHVCGLGKVQHRERCWQSRSDDSSFL
ncbi:ParB/Srx family N-terminal domain-containing protein [Sphingomonas piscis]|uniref:ParB/Srx family N-terminal domain-containing protein n=1 Tax=Sphingomonas piscis TaxID=2714943 RepID=UPI0019CFE0B0|nr:ParB/Srx family N-terminal domain-containing protein [Sphingomonas piscis]